MVRKFCSIGSTTESISERLVNVIGAPCLHCIHVSGSLDRFKVTDDGCYFFDFSLVSKEPRGPWNPVTNTEQWVAQIDIERLSSGLDTSIFLKERNDTKKSQEAITVNEES